MYIYVYNNIYNKIYYNIFKSSFKINRNSTRGGGGSLLSLKIALLLSKLRRS